MTILAEQVTAHADIDPSADILTYTNETPFDLIVLCKVNLGNSTEPILGDGVYSLRAYVDDVEISPESQVLARADQTAIILQSRHVAVAAGSVLKLSVLGRAGDSDVYVRVSVFDATPLTATDLYGDGDVVVDHDFNSVDNLRVVDPDGAGVQGVTLSFYLAAEYDAGHRTSSYLRARVQTDSYGRWRSPLLLDATTYKIVISRPSYIQTTVVELDVAGTYAGPLTVELAAVDTITGVDCGTQKLITPNVPLHLGCPVLTKTPSLTVTKGQNATVDWVLVDRQGRAVDISECLEEIDGEPGCVNVRITNALSPSATVYEFTANVIDAAQGIVHFNLPDAVRNNACVYTVEVGVVDGAGELSFSNKGLLSVERGLFGSWNTRSGPLTLEEIRMELRDRAQENDLLGDVEFDDVEILHAIIRPIQYWNELPPSIGNYHPCNFPFHGHWLKATCAGLLRISANWYERNRLRGQGGGMSEDDRNKMQTYMALANAYDQEWKVFVERKKAEINASGMYGVC